MTQHIGDLLEARPALHHVRRRAVSEQVGSAQGSLHLGTCQGPLNDVRDRGRRP